MDTAIEKELTRPYFNLVLAVYKQCLKDIETHPEEMEEYFFGEGRESWLYWLSFLFTANCIPIVDANVRSRLDKVKVKNTLSSDKKE